MYSGPRAAVSAALAVLLGIAPFTGVRAAEPIEINALLAVEEGAINAAGGVGGRPIHFVIHDDQSNPQTAVQLTSALVSKGVPAVISGGPAASCAATAATTKDSAVVFCLSGAFQPTAYSFTTPMSFQESLIAQIRFYRMRGFKKIGFLKRSYATYATPA